MTTRADLERAAELVEDLTPTATPGPWRDSQIDDNRYRALVSDVCTRQCDDLHASYAAGSDRVWIPGHPHEGYGGCLVAESQTAADRRLMAVLRNMVDDLPALLRGVAAEDPAAVGHAARAIAAAVIDTNTPREATS